MLLILFLPLKINAAVRSKLIRQSGFLKRGRANNGGEFPNLSNHALRLAHG